MNDYKPTSRRPIADVFRKTAQGATVLCVRWKIHPDVMSYLSIVASAVAAVCFWQSRRCPWLLFVGPALCYLRLWFNMLDGMVALASGKASWRGEILNDLPDRVSDVLVFVGVAHSGLCSFSSGYMAAIFALLTAYVGMFGQAVGVQREFSGIMSKPWRMVTLHVGSWVTLLVVAWYGDALRGAPRACFLVYRYDSRTILDWTCLVIILGCIQTIWVRLARIFRALRAKEAAKKP